MRYELFYLIKASQEGEMPKIKERMKGIITGSGGVFEEKETLEKRRLSYNIGQETHGIYTAQRFELEKTENIKDITSKLNLDPGVLRFILSRAEDLPELKSKEERMSEATQKETAFRKRESAKAPEKKEPEKKKVSEKVESEDIDKKLEEILNI